MTPRCIVMQAQTTPVQSAAAIMENLALPFTFAPNPPKASPAAVARAPEAVSAEETQEGQEREGSDAPQQADQASVRNVVEQLKAGKGQSGDVIEPASGSVASPDATGKLFNKSPEDPPCNDHFG